LFAKIRKEKAKGKLIGNYQNLCLCETKAKHENAQQRPPTISNSSNNNNNNYTQLQSSI